MGVGVGVGVGVGASVEAGAGSDDDGSMLCVGSMEDEGSTEDDGSVGVAVALDGPSELGSAVEDGTGSAVDGTGVAVVSDGTHVMVMDSVDHSGTHVDVMLMDGVGVGYGPAEVSLDGYAEEVGMSEELGKIAVEVGVGRTVVDGGL